MQAAETSLNGLRLYLKAPLRIFETLALSRWWSTTLQSTHSWRTRGTLSMACCSSAVNLHGRTLLQSMLRTCRSLKRCSYRRPRRRASSLFSSNALRAQQEAWTVGELRKPKACPTASLSCLLKYSALLNDTTAGLHGSTTLLIRL